MAWKVGRCDGSMFQHGRSSSLKAMWLIFNTGVSGIDRQIQAYKPVNDIFRSNIEGWGRKGKLERNYSPVQPLRTKLRTVQEEPFSAGQPLDDLKSFIHFIFFRSFIHFFNGTTMKQHILTSLGVTYEITQRYW